MRTRPLRAALAAAVLAGLVAGAPAQAGQVFTVKVGKEKAGPYRPETKVNLGKGDAKNLWYRVKSRDENDLDLVFTEASEDAPDGLKVKWFKAGNDVSHDVQTSGYEFKLKPGQSKYFNARVRATKANREHCLIGRADLPEVTANLAYGGINQECVT